MTERIPICSHKHSQTGLHSLPTNQLPSDEKLNDLAELYKVFGDKTRVKILYSLISAERCVRDISSDVKMSLSAVSHQLKILKQAKLVKYRRDGKSIIYSIADEHVKTILQNGMEHINEPK